MIFYVVLFLIGVLLMLVIGINIIQQQKERTETLRRNELLKQRAIMDETESILANLTAIPCSNRLILVLYQRMNDALINASQVAADNQKSEYQRRQINIAQQITTLAQNDTPPPAIESFRLPDNDKQILQLVQCLKKMKAILRIESNKGRIEPGVFNEEEKRIDNLQLRINVESMLSRARSACEMKQYGSAKQMVTKALATLNAIKRQTPKDPFIVKKVDDAKKLLDIIMGDQKTQAPPQPMPEPEKQNDELDILFQQKRKW
ncbi:hypothetical protein NFHSH190041_14040 [Shewanella sp. NFH-SH190041]|uniref:hypothetical protein n=1 Tax=Shewanella sp. NFH-SH190041 TaxID=2950245 RepID=UPI0021C2F011|nr:hypothetical protein [Shewanella sp. NFH-SH190041]BDM63952.1 hypothetical protein NFHSH190041_14040 [Shewanella sp. NFH-SH190041]